MKQRMLSIARKVRMIPVLEAVRFVQRAMETRAENREFLGKIDGFPKKPPLWLMHDMYAHTSYSLYESSGRNHAERIANLIDRFVSAKTPEVAEWGCGLSRILRHLPRNYSLTGYDYNSDAIQWCRKNIPGIAFLANEARPPLPADANRFDAIYSVSVFTHLSEKGHDEWISELHRVLKPGGVLISTFHGQHQTGSLLLSERRKFDAGQLVVRGNTKEGRRNFVAYHPDAYVRDILLKSFDVMEGPTQAFGQTLWVAQKSAEASTKTRLGWRSR
jgi:SAM-dependent methyltransferase